jgi:hypothetical protein
MDTQVSALKEMAYSFDSTDSRKTLIHTYLEQSYGLPTPLSGTPIHSLAYFSFLLKTSHLSAHLD